MHPKGQRVPHGLYGLHERGRQVSLREPHGGVLLPFGGTPAGALRGVDEKYV